MKVDFFVKQKKTGYKYSKYVVVNWIDIFFTKLVVPKIAIQISKLSELLWFPKYLKVIAIESQMVGPISKYKSWALHAGSRSDFQSFELFPIGKKNIEIYFGR